MKYPRQHVDKVKSFLNTPKCAPLTSGLEKLLKPATAAGRSRTRRLAVVLHTLAEMWLHRACEAPTRTTPRAPCCKSFRAPSTDCMPQKARTLPHCIIQQQAIQRRNNEASGDCGEDTSPRDRILTSRGRHLALYESFVVGTISILNLTPKDHSTSHSGFKHPSLCFPSSDGGMKCLSGGGIVTLHERE